ncbi:MAG TPA: hypothetical protein DIU11_11355, partial [Pusillimonas sp.]|nr:hypothetical protein [Pusillimonas sp.]
MHAASNYTGTTTLNSGQLNTFNPYALGNNSAVTVNTNAALSLGDHLRIGSLAGNGTVNLAGTPGPNTLTSGANNASTIFSGVISGADGRLTKTGTGTLTLTGTNTYTGATTVDAGALVVTGSIANSAITVNGSARLGGNGFMGDLFLKGGTLAPGNSIGSITVADVDFSSGGIYEVEVNASGDADKIIASGNATLTGGRVSVLPEPGSYASTTDYTIVQAGSIAGEFDSVSVDLPNFAFLQASLGYSATTVSLRLKRNDNVFNALGTTANTVNTANALSQAYSRGLLTDITDNLIVLDKANAQKALESLSGNQLSQGSTLALLASRRFSALLNKRSRKMTPYPGSNRHPISDHRAQRLGKVENGHFAALSDTSTTAADLSLSQNSGIWLAPQAGFGSIDGNSNARGTDYKYGGIAAGYDYWLNSTVLTGASLSYSETRADDHDLNSVETALYGRILLNSNRYLYGSIGIGRHQVSSVRRVKAGSLVSQATGHYDIDTRSASLEFGQAFAIDQNVTITPFLGVEYTHLDRAGFAETGAGQASLNSAENRQESLRSQLGLRLTTDFTTTSARQWRMDASLAWLHEFADTTANVDAAFTDAPGIQFNTTGPDLSRDQAQLQLNITTALSNRSSLKIGYQGDLSRTHQEHNAYATFRLFIIKGGRPVFIKLVFSTNRLNGG